MIRQFAKRRLALLGASAIALPALLASCGGGEASNRVSAGDAFTFEVPEELAPEGDSTLATSGGALTSETYRLSFRTGDGVIHSNGSSRPDFRVSLLEVDGREARIEWFSEPDADPSHPYVAILYVEDIGEAGGLAFSVRYAAEDKDGAVRSIMRSIDWAEDPS